MSEKQNVGLLSHGAVGLKSLISFHSTDQTLQTTLDALEQCASQVLNQRGVDNGRYLFFLSAFYTLL